MHILCQWQDLRFKNFFCGTCLVLIALLDNGCSILHARAQHNQAAEIVFSDPEVNRALTESARQVAQSMNQWTAIQSYMHPEMRAAKAPIFGALAMPSDIDWDGPIEPLLETLAGRLSFQFSIQGTHPYTPLQIAEHDHAQSMFFILRSIGSQLGNQATVRIDTAHHLLLLEYHNNIASYNVNNDVSNDVNKNLNRGRQ